MTNVCYEWTRAGWQNVFTMVNSLSQHWTLAHLGMNREKQKWVMFAQTWTHFLMENPNAWDWQMLVSCKSSKKQNELHWLMFVMSELVQVDQMFSQWWTHCLNIWHLHFLKKNKGEQMVFSGTFFQMSIGCQLSNNLTEYKFFHECSPRLRN